MLKIIAKYRPNATDTEKKTGWTVTFEEFLRYVTDGLREGIVKRYWDHWDTYEQLCNPCQVKYDFIGDIESENNKESNALLIGQYLVNCKCRHTYKQVHFISPEHVSYLILIINHCEQFQYLKAK